MSKRHGPLRAPVQVPEQSLEPEANELEVGLEGGEYGNSGAVGAMGMPAAPPEEPTPILNLAARQLGIQHSELSSWFGEEEEEELTGLGLATPAGIQLAAGANQQVATEEMVHMRQHALGTGGASDSSSSDAAEVEAALIANQIEEGLAPSDIVQKASARRMHNNPVTHQQIADIRSLAQTHAGRIHNVIESWTTDQAVQDAVHSFFAAMRAGGARSAAYVDAARRILQEEFEGVALQSLGEALRADISGEHLSTVMGWIRVRGVEGSTPAPAPPPEQATETDVASEGEQTETEESTESAGPITSDERRLLDRAMDAHVRQAVAALADELDDFNVVDRTVLGILETYRRQVGDTLRQSESDDQRGDLRQAMIRLRHAYGRDTNRSLATDIENGMSFGDLDQALRWIGARASGPTVEGVSSPEARDRDARARVAAGADELHTAIEAMIASDDPASELADVDAAHNRMVNAALYQHGGRESGVERADAHTMVREEYTNVTGRSIAAHVGLAVPGSGAAADRLRASIRTRIGIVPVVPSGGESAAGESGEAGESGDAARSIVRRHARLMAREVGELRQSTGPAAYVDVGDIDDLWDEMQDEVTPLFPTNWRTEFDDAFRAETGAGFQAALLAACEGSDYLVGELNDRLGFHMVVSSDRSRGGGETDVAEADDLGIVLLELHELLDENYVDNAPVMAALRRARAAGRQADPPLDAAGIRDAYQDRYHVGLENQLRARLSSETVSDALGLIGAREDVTQQVLDDTATAGELDGEADRHLRELSEQYRAIAVEIHRSPGLTVEISRRWRGLHDHRHESVEGRLPSVSDSRDLLVQHYAALYGDLLSALVSGQAPDETFERFGWRSRAEATGIQHEANEQGEALTGGDDWPEQRFSQGAGAFLLDLYRAVETEMSRSVCSHWDEAMNWMQDTQVTEARRRELVLERYEARFGIAFSSHVTRRFGRALLRTHGTEIASHIGFTLGQREVAETVPAESGDGSSALATQLAASIDDADLQAMADVMVGARGGDGRTRDEREAILAEYRRLRPNTPIGYAVFRAFNRDPGQLARARSLCSIAGRTSTRDHLLELIETQERDRVTAVMLRLSDAERRQLRTDSGLTAALERNFDDEDYQRFRSMLSGSWGADDAIRENDRIWGVGAFGTDEDGANADLTSLARAEHTRIELHVRGIRPALNDAQRSRRIRLEMRAWGAEQQADPNMVELMLDELEPEEIDHAGMLLESDGSLGDTETIIDDLSADNLIEQLEGLSDEQRTALSEDQGFRERLHAQNPDNYTHAIAVLEGRGNLGSVVAGSQTAWWDDTDEDRMMRDMSEMSVEEMRAYQRDRESFDSVRGSLDDSRDERQLHDRMSVDQREILHEDDDAAQARLRLIYQHKYRIIQGVYSTEDRFLRAVLQFHNDRQEASDNHEHLDPDAVHEIDTAVDEALHQVSHARISTTARRSWDQVVAGDDSAVRQMLRAGVIYADDPTIITNTISTASSEYVADHWANILLPDRRGRKMKDVVQAFVGNREDPQTQRALREFQLDAAADVLQLLLDEEGLQDTQERQMLDWQNALRAKIFALTGAQIAASLGRGGVEGLTSADHDLLTGDERLARSRQVQSMDEREIMRDWSLADPFFGDERQASEATGNQLGSEFSAATEDGELSEAELANLSDLRTDLADAITEYREAREATAQVAKIIGGVIVTAVATALTGPGGLTLGGALLEAAASAALAEGLDELCNRSENAGAQDLAKALVTDAFTTAITHTAGSYFRTALVGIQTSGRFADRIGQFQAALARQPRLLQIGVEAAGNTAVNTSQSFATDILNTVGTNIYEDGLIQGMRDSSGDIADEFSDLGYDLVRQYLIQTVDRGVHHLTPPQVQELFSASADNGRERSLGESAASLGARATTPVLQELRDEGASQIASAVTGGDQAGDFELDEFGNRVARRGLRQGLSAVVTPHAEAIRNRRRAAAVTEYMQTAEWEAVRRRLRRPPDMDEEDFEALLEHTLQTRGLRRTSDNPLDQADVAGGREDSEEGWTPRGQRETRNILEHRLRRISTLWRGHPAVGSGSDLSSEDREAFRTWVYSSPGGVESKLRDSNWAVNFDRWRGSPDEATATQARADRSPPTDEPPE